MQGFLADTRAFLRGIWEVKVDLGLLYFVFGEGRAQVFFQMHGVLAVTGYFLADVYGSYANIQCSFADIYVGLFCGYVLHGLFCVSCVKDEWM